MLLDTAEDDELETTLLDTREDDELETTLLDTSEDDELTDTDDTLDIEEDDAGALSPPPPPPPHPAINTDAIKAIDKFLSISLTPIQSIVLKIQVELKTAANRHMKFISYIKYMNIWEYITQKRTIKRNLTPTCGSS